MSKLLQLIGLLLAAAQVHAQGYADLSGDVDQLTADSVAVSWRVQPYEAHDHVVAARLDKRGGFQLRVPLTGPTAVRFSYGTDDVPLFLEPGNALRLRFKGETLETSLKVQPANDDSKQAENANSYLADFDRTFTDNEAYQVLPENIELFEKPFLSFLSYRRTKQYDLLHSQGKRAFTPAFAAYANAEIAYLYANDRLSYPQLREQVVVTGDRQQPSSGYYDFLTDPALVPGPEDAPVSEQYQEFLLGYLHRQVQASGTPATAVGYYPACYRLARQQLHGALLLPVLGQVLAETIRFGHIAHAEALLANFARTAPPAATALLRQDLAAHRALAIGTPAPSLPLRTLTGDTLRLDSYAGKLRYVMFWDSRLALCQREMPFLKEECIHFVNQPVVFITAALDADPTAWRRNVGALPPAATHAWVPADQQAAVRAAYGIQQLPAFVLLDEQGRLLDPRPKRLSSRALQDDLKAAQGRAAAYLTVPLPK